MFKDYCTESAELKKTLKKLSESAKRLGKSFFYRVYSINPLCNYRGALKAPLFSKILIFGAFSPPGIFKILATVLSQF